LKAKEASVVTKTV